MSGARRSRSNRSTPLRAGALIAVLATLIGYDVYRESVHLPLALAYVSPTASTVLFTADVEKTWDEFAEHIGPIVRQPRAEAVVDAVEDMKNGLAELCVAPQNGADLRRFGIDARRGAAAAIIGPPEETFSESNFIAVLPITSNESFLKALTSLEMTAGRVTITAADNTRKPRGFRIRLAEFAASGRLCALQNDQLIEIRDEEVYVDNGDLNFVPDWFDESEFGIECRAIYEEGEDGACQCELELGDFTADAENCLDRIKVMPDAEARNAYPVGTIEIAALAGRDFLGLVLPDEETTMVFVDDRWVLISQSEEALAGALADPERNLAFHENSDALRDLAESSRQKDSDDALGAPILAGKIRYPWLYSSSPVAFNLRTTPSKLSLDLLAKLPSGEITVVDRLTRSSDRTHPVEIVPYGSKVALALADRHLAYYLRYLFEYVDGAFDGVEQKIGHLAATIRELSKSDSLSALSLTVPALKDGVPEFAVVGYLGDRATAERIVLDLQRQLRIQRDTEILRQAIGQYVADNESLPAAISELTRASGDASPYLKIEPDDTWANYVIDDGSPVMQAQPNDVLASDGYAEVTAEGLTLRYLLPAVTENDIRYRYDDLATNDGDEEASQTIEALKEGAYRLATVYVQDTGMLWIGTNADVIKSIMSAGADRRQSARYVDARRQSGGNGAVRATMFAQTGWMLEQGLAHQDAEIAEIAETFVDLSDYERLLVTVMALEERNGLKARIELIK